MTPMAHRVAARWLEARRLELSPELTKAFRKEFLGLVGNVKRVRDVGDLDTFYRTGLRWRERMQEFAGQIRLDLESRQRDRDMPQQARDWAGYYLENMGPVWDMLHEWGSMPPGHTLKYFRDHGWTDDRIWREWEKESPKWDRRIRRHAQGAWRILNEIAEWASRGGLYGGGERPVGITDTIEERARLEGFDTLMRGYDDADPRTRGDKLDMIKASLKRFKQRAGQTLPIMLKLMLPIEFDWTFGAKNQGWAAGRYEQDHILITPWGLSGKPDELVHILAHEMGHHLWRTAVKAGAKEFWKAAIRADRGDLDLRDALAQMERAGASYFIDDELALSDPILYLQLQTLGEDPSYKGFGLWNADSVREYLADGNDPIVRVPRSPITGYAAKNPEEAFCEAVGRLVAYGTKAVHDTVLGWLKIMLPNVRFSSMANRIASRWLAAYSVDKRRLALFRAGNPGGRTFVLYDAETAKEVAQDEDAYWDGGIEKALLGYIEFSDSQECSAENVYEINRVVAIRGHGPLLYDLALSYAKKDGMAGLVSDRSKVTPAAQKVWMYYFERRSDVQKTPLDEPSRQCEHPKGGPLNHIYSLSSPMSWVRTLEANHHACAREMADIGIHYSADEFETHLWEEGDSMFRSMYDG